MSDRVKYKAKVVVGMSGGVDSSVAALLLKQAGYEVIGLFMNNWEEEEDGVCTSADDWRDVQAVCGKLDIPHYSINFSSQYMQHVFSYFLKEYALGRTPNPDVLCNREIKFGSFREYAYTLGADYIATGHYCDIEHEGGTKLKKAADQGKDQTYFLCDVSTNQLENTIFPLGKLKKEQVRKIAEENGLVTAKKRDSTGICFIGERNFKKFLSQYLPAKEGEIRDTAGKKIGTHSGLMYYTIGQRRGFGVGGLKGYDQNRWYVVDKDLKNNVLIVSNGEGEELYSSGLRCKSINWIGKFDFSDNFDCTAKFRYRQPEQRVNVTKTANGIEVKFYERQRAITTGQYAVLYSGDYCLGGGVIDEVIK